MEGFRQSIDTEVSDFGNIFFRKKYIAIRTIIQTEIRQHEFTIRMTETRHIFCGITVGQLHQVKLKGPENHILGSIFHATRLQGIHPLHVPKAIEVFVVGSFQFATRQELGRSE